MPGLTGHLVIRTFGVMPKCVMPGLTGHLVIRTFGVMPKCVMPGLTGHLAIKKTGCLFMEAALVSLYCYAPRH